MGIVSNAVQGIKWVVQMTKKHHIQQRHLDTSQLSRSRNKKNMCCNSVRVIITWMYGSIQRLTEPLCQPHLNKTESTETNQLRIWKLWRSVLCYVVSKQKWHASTVYPARKSVSCQIYLIIAATKTEKQMETDKYCTKDQHCNTQITAWLTNAVIWGIKTTDNTNWDKVSFGWEKHIICFLLFLLT